MSTHNTGTTITSEVTLLKRDIALLKQQQAESSHLLKSCKGHVGMMLGEEIESHLAEVNGTYFNARDYHYEKPNGEQGI